MKSKTITSVLAAVGLSVALVACGGAKENTGSPKSEPSSSVSAPDKSSAPAKASAPATAAAPAVGSGEASVSIDGKAVDLKDTTVVCQEAAGTMNIAIGSASGTDAIGAVLTPGDNPSVKSVGLGSQNGTAMGWAEGAPGKAKATKDGKVYTITGELMAVDMANPSAPSQKAFELKVTCP